MVQGKDIATYKFPQGARMKIKKKGHKYSRYRDNLRMTPINNFGDKCKDCENKLTSKEKEVCGKC